MLGAILGDIAGSVYEWDNVKTKDFQPLIAPHAFFTDDTVLTVAVAETRFGIPEELAQEAWARLPSDIRQVLHDLYAAAGYKRVRP